MNMNTQINISHKQLFKMSVVALLVALVLIAISSKSQAQDRTLTLQEAVKLGLENSKSLKYSQAKIEEAVSQYNQAKDKALPTGAASFTYDRAEIPANVLALGKSKISLPTGANAWLGILSVNETIFGGNKLKYARQSTDLLTQVSRLDADKDKDQIAFDVISAYYNLYKVLQSIKVVNQNINTVDAQIHQAQRFFDQGLVTKNDVLRFQLQKSNIQLNGIDLESNRKIINYNLDILLGLPETTTIHIDTLQDAGKTVGTLQNYLDSAMVNRQELKQLDIRHHVAEINVKDTKSNLLPTLGASVGAYYVDIAANPFPTTGNYITPVTAGLTLSWNFGALWTNKNKLSQARIQQEEVEINRGITLDNVKQEVNQDYQNYLTALNKIELLQTSIAQAGENNKILESKYQSNIASATDRADAETLLYQAQINLELAKADAGLAYYTLIKSTGTLNK